MLLSKLFKKKDNTPHCAVVIVAAGSSLRMGGDKLMMELCHVPVLARTLLAFQQSPLVDEIIVVTRMEKIMDVADICKKYGVTKAKRSSAAEPRAWNPRSPECRSSRAGRSSSQYMTARARL